MLTGRWAFNLARRPAFPPVSGLRRRRWLLDLGAAARSTLALRESPAERLAAGARLGPYEIEALIGAGGMGAVYRAIDTRLGREVAVKVLPDEFAADPNRLHRFEREARAVAALDHPNILTLHDVGMAEPKGPGTPIHYLVTELLEGQTLRERIAEGPIPVAGALEIGLQVAKALAAAHGKGIVHRDLKPSNVFLTSDGLVKVLDFGIARVVAPAGEAAPMSTGVVTTETDVRVGTAGYMSPEQVRGQPVDPRSDLFSFGALLYEMLTGQRAFAGDTAADTAAAILNAEPRPPSEVGLSIGRSLQGILACCLAKSPEDRFASAGDLVRALGAVSEADDRLRAVRPFAVRRRRFVMAAIAAGRLTARTKPRPTLVAEVLIA